MELRDYCFPVIERKVVVHNGQSEQIDLGDNQSYLSGDYKAIVRQDTNELISIVRDSYQIVPNETLIGQLMEQLDKLATPFEVEPSHSFVENNRMRLQVKFPGIQINDGRSDIALSLYLHNSYDMSEGVRMFWGAIRAICTNGMVFGQVMGSIYRRHTKGFQMDNLQNELSQAYEMMPRVKNRIAQLIEKPVNEDIKQDVESELGKKFAKPILEPEYESQWKLYNAITYAISHAIQQRYRARYQMATAKVFGL
jgi:hypothetical protein